MRIFKKKKMKPVLQEEFKWNSLSIDEFLGLGKDKGLENTWFCEGKRYQGNTCIIRISENSAT
jgi:hypothetical protein